MARRPSSVSLSSINSTGGLSKLVQLPSTSQSLANGSRPSDTLSTRVPSRGISASWKIEEVPDHVIDEQATDELFVKHSVAEVRAIQQKLRADADAKQQELRAMVGERYRDLLQASTSIISIAKSADNVTRAFEEMRNMSADAAPSRLSKPAPSVSQEDAHLHALQTLSAHMKLLLDAPEHLWRLMERKKYLHASWLFLLCRVVHRALLREDDDDYSSWNAHGIDVSEQFPLVQRQWDVVSQFRTQITHKATLSLRENPISPATVCASLLALHLIESRPLLETLSIFLSQRSRSLASLLSKSHDSQANGDAHGSRHGDTRPSGKLVLRRVQSRMESVLELISSTIGTARRIFIGADNDDALMTNVLRYVQDDSSTIGNELPTELRLSTNYLLSTLPSSSHFLLLPANIKSYKPYLEGDAVTNIPRNQINDKLGAWFQNSTQDLKASAEKWLSELRAIREIWRLRSNLRNSIDQAEGLEHGEKGGLTQYIDELCLQKAASVWNSELRGTIDAFGNALQAALRTLNGPNAHSLIDIKPERFMFQPPPKVPSSQSGFGAAVSEGFDQYKTSLKQRITSRTPLVNEVLSVLEQHAHALLHDVSALRKAKKSSGEDLVIRIFELYQADVTTFLDTVLSTLESAATGSSGQVQSVTFIGRLAGALSSSSSRFTRDLQSSAESDEAFRARLKTLHDNCIRQWRDRTVEEVIIQHWPLRRLSHAPVNLVEVDTQTQQLRPSPAILNALLALSQSVHQVGIPSDHERARRAQQLLERFVNRSVTVLSELETSYTPTMLRQAVYDLFMLRSTIGLWDADLQRALGELDEIIARFCDKLIARIQLRVSVTDSSASLQELQRLQTLLYSLLPARVLSSDDQQHKAKVERNVPSMPLGTPKADPQQHAILDLAKPSPRFGLLLVGGATSR
ncbi:hypothetical protein K474DRAFT_1694424 [Panus rudis PR-1116 ss-1]|nr:hypothetical protein K474DRAFT_1694424 [Panus rudis PR-1116 ss-1]